MRRPARRAVLAGALAACLAGCVSLPLPKPPYGGAQAPGLPERIELADVPFHPQEDYQCGPAALATVLNAAGIARTPQELIAQVYLPQRQGSLQPELFGAARRAGVLPYELRALPNDLLQEVAAGHPVVVLQNLRPLLPLWHYAVVVGYDLPAGQVVLRSGRERRLVMAMDDFDRTWARGQRWAFVALPPGQLPATARETEYVAAAAALERVARPAGRQAYATALAAWPGNLFARLASGNAAYRERQLELARQEFQRAATEHPEAADAWNNLAQVLHEQGRPAQALEAAQRAVALGGPRLATYEATLNMVEAAARH
jgi:tetratricopeptide (TPR) repeat protein